MRNAKEKIKDKVTTRPGRPGRHENVIELWKTSVNLENS